MDSGLVKGRAVTHRGPSGHRMTQAMLYKLVTTHECLEKRVNTHKSCLVCYSVYINIDLR